MARYPRAVLLYLHGGLYRRGAAGYACDLGARASGRECADLYLAADLHAAARQRYGGGLFRRVFCPHLAPVARDEGGRRRQLSGQGGNKEPLSRYPRHLRQF